MRILIVTPWYPTVENPQTGVFVQRDVETLRRSHEVSVLHLSTSTDRPLDGTAVERIPYAAASLRGIRRARRAIRERAAGVDIVHSHAISALPAVPRTLSVPWVHTEHWSGLLSPRTAPLPVRVVGGWMARLLQHPAVVIAVSEQLATAVRRTRTGPTVVVPNAVSAPVEPPRDITDLVIVGVGGLIGRKRPVLAVETVAALVGRGRDPRLIWAGDGPERDRVLARASELGVRDRVELRGNVDPAEISGLLGSARVFLLPTEGETFGVAIAEALRHGLPVVVGDEGGHTEFVRAEDGALVGTTDATDWAAAVEDVLDRDRDAIRRSAELRFSDDARRAAFDAVYETALDRKGQR